MGTGAGAGTGVEDKGAGKSRKEIGKLKRIEGAGWTQGRERRDRREKHK